MVSNLDIRRVANLLIREHGADLQSAQPGSLAQIRAILIGERASRCSAPSRTAATSSIARFHWKPP
jgi:hypothetical protein